MPDLADLSARFTARLRVAGLPVGPDRCTRFTEAVTELNPASLTELRHCALATVVSDPDQIPTFEAVFAAVFGGLVDVAEHRGHGQPSGHTAPRPAVGEVRAGVRPPAGHSAGQDREVNVLASAAERLASKDFAELTPAELAELRQLMRQFTVSTPPRNTYRWRTAPHGRQVDLRATLARARRTGGHPLRLVRRDRKVKPRKLIVLCDISGSMAPYARAMIQLLYCAAGGARAEVFTFATRLTRLTRELTGARPSVAIERAGQAAPDWSGGTRIAHALAEFNRIYGRRGMARGAVVLIISDGWETGDPTNLGTQLATLSTVAYRIVWANPRTARPGYQPLAAGMAAAWPHCDAVVSAHRLDALADLTIALRRGQSRSWSKANLAAAVRDDTPSLA